MKLPSDTNKIII